MDEQPSDYADRLLRDAHSHWRTYLANRYGQLAAMLAVAGAGALTAFVGSGKAVGTFMDDPSALMITGVVSALGAALTQGFNFSKNASRHYGTKIALKTIADQVRFGVLAPDEATRWALMANTDPEAAILGLKGSAQ